MDSPAITDTCWCEDPVMLRLSELYRELIAHDGFGELRVDVRILKRKQKEVIITCGKQYRYVVDGPEQNKEGDDGKERLLPQAGRGEQQSTKGGCL